MAHLGNRLGVLTRIIDIYSNLCAKSDCSAVLLIKLGQRYRGIYARNSAALTIQSIWNMGQLKRNFISDIKRERAAHILQRVIGRFRFLNRMASKAKDRRASITAAAEIVSENFKMQWSIRYKGQKRVVVMMASSGFSSEIKKNHLAPQTEIFGRLIELYDPNVTIIYVSYKLNCEQQVFLDGLQTNAFKNNELERLHMIIVPENRIYHKTVSLCRRLIIAPDEIQEISRLVDEQNAYFSPTMIGYDELELSVLLKIPCFGTYETVQNLALNYKNQHEFILNAGCEASVGKILFNA